MDGYTISEQDVPFVTQLDRKEDDLQFSLVLTNKMLKKKFPPVGKYYWVVPPFSKFGLRACFCVNR